MGGSQENKERNLLRMERNKIKEEKHQENMEENHLEKEGSWAKCEEN